MHSRKNVVLMFLIIMLSFAKSIEISTEPNDEAEISDSGLNDSHGLFNPGISKRKISKYLKSWDEKIILHSK